jgi:hypothetical protein
MHAFGAGYFFPPGAESIILEIRQPADSVPRVSLADFLDRIGLELCYCSVYGTHCKTASHRVPPSERLECRSNQEG